MSSLHVHMFSSFAMASFHPDLTGEVDIVSEGEVSVMLVRYFSFTTNVQLFLMYACSFNVSDVCCL